MRPDDDIWINVLELSIAVMSAPVPFSAGDVHDYEPIVCCCRETTLLYVNVAMNKCRGRREPRSSAVMRTVDVEIDSGWVFTAKHSAGNVQ